MASSGSSAKPLASLSSGLLARKGQARPAMRPQGFHGYGATASVDDLGWNDMGGHELPPVLVEREELKAEVEAPAETPKVAISPVRAARIARQAVTKHPKSAFTLRLDGDRHLRLRLASAVTNRSAQQIVTEALDAFLQTLPEVEELVRQLPGSARR
ncbi:hypothetical protein BH09PSE4_BH09PSE4_11860 [soil metagenome]